MKKIILTCILSLAAGMAVRVAAQVPMNLNNQGLGARDQYGNQIDPNRQPDKLEDSVDVQAPPPKLYAWRIDELLGEREMVAIDTATLNFQNTNLVEGMTGHYNYLANLGTSRLSRIFNERYRGNAGTDYFVEPLSSFFFRPNQLNFTNSNIPFTNLTYYKGGSKTNGEERFKSYFSVNVNKRLALGFNFDYLYGRGYYANQSASHFNAGLFASYIGQKYQMHAIYNNFFFKMNENGGITDDRYITRPEEMDDAGGSQYIPVAMEETSNRNHNFHVFLTHRYRLGFEREVVALQPKEETSTARQSALKAIADSLNVPIDSLPPSAVPMDTIRTTEFVPVTSFIHTLKIERTSHRFRSGMEAADAYSNTYYQSGLSNDTTVALSIRNTFGIALLEGFNKYAKAGLTAYLSHKFNRYDLMGDSATNAIRRPVRHTEQEVYVGGELAKRQGQTLHYRVNGEIGVIGQALGQFRVNGDLDLNFRLGKDSVNFYARGYITNTLPSFYMRHYHSNHYYWDNENMDKEFRTRIEGELNIAHWRTNLKAGVENIKNYTYFNSNAMPTQHGGSIQVIDATLRQDFQLGVFHLDNEVTWQKSSNQHVLPLPDFSLYHNLYIQGKLFKKVLTVQLGADVRYFTEYNAPAYTPAIQHFNVQDPEHAIKIGGYPIINVYANLHLKRTRLFAMMYHVNQGMGNRNAFFAPHYPINPRLLKIGVSWNFFD